MTIAKVRQATEKSTSSIYAGIAAGTFPKGDLVAAQSRRWKSTDIAAWLLRQSDLTEQREANLAGALRAKAAKGVAASRARQTE